MVVMSVFRFSRKQENLVSCLLESTSGADVSPAMLWFVFRDWIYSIYLRSVILWYSIRDRYYLIHIPIHQRGKLWERFLTKVGKTYIIYILFPGCRCVWGGQVGGWVIRNYQSLDLFATLLHLLANWAPVTVTFTVKQKYGLPEFRYFFSFILK